MELSLKVFFFHKKTVVDLASKWFSKSGTKMKKHIKNWLPPDRQSYQHPRLVCSDKNSSWHLSQKVFLNRLRCALTKPRRATFFTLKGKNTLEVFLHADDDPAIFFCLCHQPLRKSQRRFSQALPPDYKRIFTLTIIMADKHHQPLATSRLSPFQHLFVSVWIAHMHQPAFFQWIHGYPETLPPLSLEKEYLSTIFIRKRTAVLIAVIGCPINEPNHTLRRGTPKTDWP